MWAISGTLNAASSATRRAHGDRTPWDEVYVPCAPTLDEADRLQAIPITRLEREAPWIEERYACDAHGMIAVEMRNPTSHDVRRYRLRGSMGKDPREVG